MDPLEVRLRNVPDNRRTDYERQLRQCAELIGWNSHPHRTAPNRSNDELKVGIGFALSTWGGGGGPECKVEVRVLPDASVEVLSGTQDLGTGTRTYVAAIVAEELGLELNQVTARIGRSSYGAANASGGSTTTASLAPAVKHAAWNARKALFQHVGTLLGVKPENLRIAGGRIEDSTNPESNWIGFKDACAAVGGQGISAQGEWQRELASNGVGGAQAAKVQVDTLTGEIQVLHMVGVQDCGLVMNRLATRSQLNGFEDYKIAGCKEIGLMQPVLDDGDERNGVIGMSEPAVVPGQSAIANAIMNACGARLREMPLTCDKLLMALRGAKRG
jgi:xanthine dehydrogenase YagR molybdenum-binding subunit